MMLTGGSLDEGKPIGNHPCRATIAAPLPEENGEDLPLTKQISTYTSTVHGHGDAHNMVQEYAQKKPLGKHSGHDAGHMPTCHPVKSRNSNYAEILSAAATIAARHDLTKHHSHAR